MTLISGVWTVHHNLVFPRGVVFYVWDDLLDYAPTVIHPLFGWPQARVTHPTWAWVIQTGRLPGEDRQG